MIFRSLVFSFFALTLASSFFSSRASAQVCSAFEALIKDGHADQFDLQNPYALCALTWKNPQPIWQISVAAKAVVQAYGAADYKAQTRSELLKQGRILRSDQERAAILIASRQARDRAANLCCGTDAECVSAMKQVEISFCASEADDDSSKPDPCANFVAAYVTEEPETAKFTKYVASRTRGAFLSADMVRSADLALVSTDPEKRSLLSISSGKSSPTDAAKAFSYSQQPPFLGRISMGPYREDTETMSFAIGTLYHELGHACSATQRQLELVRKQGSVSPSEAASYTQMFYPNCSSGGGAWRQTYAPILRAAGAGPAVNDCLVDLAYKSTDEKSSAYVAGACAVSHLEEATAEAFSLLSMQIAPNAYPERACSRLPSKLHAASTDVFACILRGTPSKQHEFRTAENCETPAISKSDIGRTGEHTSRTRSKPSKGVR